MIDKIAVQGFKSFKQVEIPLKPLTVLGGVNGSGKSSLMQLLLLLKAYALEAKADGVVELNNGEIDLGTRKDVIYRWSPDRVIRITFSYSSGVHVVSSPDEPDSSRHDYITFETVGDGFQHSPLVEFFQKKLHYLSADRQSPQSMHANSAYAVKMRNVGRHGENAVSLLYAHSQEEIPVELCHDDHPSNRTLKGQVNAWLGEVSHGVAVRTEPVGDLIRLDVDYGATNAAKGFRPENVGFGVSYVLPVLVMILTAQKDDCLLIENPGAHLHPQGQAQLGRLLAKASAYGIQIVIETHSDHVVNGIRVGCKKRADEHPDECVTSDGVSYYKGTVINFFERTSKGLEAEEEQFTIVTPIRIEATGELECYPDHFLDEWPRQMGELA